MPINASSSSDSAPSPLPGYCPISEVSLTIFTSFFVSYMVLFPVFIFVLYVGYQQQRHRRSAAIETRHSDIFTFHMVHLQIIGGVGVSIYCYGAYTNGQVAQDVGTYTYSVVSPGETLFHLLTCMERYLAVVHPVTYRRLRQADGVRIRHISIGCVWLICCSVAGLSKISLTFSVIYTFVFLVSASTIVAFCSISVLFVLLRPGPGEVAGCWERVDQTKKRAFYTILVIMVTLLLRFLSYLMYTIVSVMFLIKTMDPCVIFWSMHWFSIPSILVLPLLFLHRAGKLPSCRHSNAESVKNLQHIM